MHIEIFRQSCRFFSFLNNSPVGAVLASSWFIFVPYNILIVYYKAKYLTVKIDVFILPYKKRVIKIVLKQTKSIICVANFSSCF